MPRDEMLREIGAGNRLRAEAQLPLLSIEAELERMEQVQREAEFQLVWLAQRHRFAHQWLRNSSDGWAANMGRYTLAQTRVREEWMRGEHSVEPK